MIVVSNTSPITNLAAVGQLDLLQQLYQAVIISEVDQLINVGFHIKQDLYQRVLQVVGE